MDEATAIPIVLVVEDELSSTVLKELIRHYAPEIVVADVYGLEGFGWIRRNLHGINRTARGIPFLTLIDLDSNECPRLLIDGWLRAPQAEDHLIRVAVPEVEAWIIGDRVVFSQWTGVSVDLLPDRPEESDPKQVVIEAVRQSRNRLLREDIVPRSGARLGRDYNGRMSGFVRGSWNPERARRSSESLDRAVTRLLRFRERKLDPT